MEELNNEIYENARKKSVNSDTIKIKREVYRKKRQQAFNQGFKKGFIVGVTASVIAISGIAVGANKVAKQIDLNHFPYEYVSAGYESVGASSYILPLRVGDTEYRHAYHIDVIADAISEGDFDSELYGAYRGMKSDGIGMSAVESNMDSVVYYCHLDGLTDCSSFVEYCERNGFVDENGKIDHKAYNQAMKLYLEGREEMDKAQESMPSIKH